jgi:hypothetical protein
MRIAIVRDGVVENVVNASESFQPGVGSVAVPTEIAGPGWIYQDGAFASPAEDASPVPECVEMWQARAVLKATTGHSQGQTLLDEANALVDASNNPALQAFWEFSPQLHRASPTLAMLSSALGLTSDDVDALFRSAAALSL